MRPRKRSVPSRFLSCTDITVLSRTRILIPRPTVHNVDDLPGLIVLNWFRILGVPIELSLTWFLLKVRHKLLQIALLDQLIYFFFNILQPFVVWSIFLWNIQYFGLSFFDESVIILFGHLTNFFPSKQFTT